MLSFLLVKLHTNKLQNADYGDVTILMAYMVFLNVILSYGMETAFFRFYNTENNKQKVVQTSLISILITSISFLLLGLLFKDYFGNLLKVDVRFVVFALLTLVLDALVIIPFSVIRVNQRPILFAIIKIGNVIVTLLLNLFFLLYLGDLANTYPDSFFNAIFIENFKIGYVFIAGLISSLLTFIVLIPYYLQISWQIDTQLWKKMMRYGFPILIAGIAFAVNEHLDKIILGRLLPESIAKSEVGAYSACYKLGLFMVLFATAFRLGIEPFFFSQADKENAQQTYALITKYFVIFGSVILLSVIVFADILKIMLLDNSSYWVAMKVVPLIILANFFLGIYNNLSVWYKVTNKTKIGAYISIIGAIITLVLNYVLIPIMSYYGAAIATIAAYGTMMIISYILGNKYYPIPYDLKKIGGYLLLSIGFSAISFYGFRENYVVGISLLLLFLAFVYKNEKSTLERIINKKSK
jgi:O-antigen/teichoic acid export membrane protein